MRLLLAMLTAGTAILGAATASRACPFCTTASQTLSEEIDSMDVVVLARLLQPPPPAAADVNDPSAPLPKAKFQVQRVLKGDKHVRVGEELELLAWGETAADKRYLAMAVVSPQMMWSTPLALSERACEYVLQLPALPKDPARLAFFQEHLEDADEILARDAYDEFAKTPYQGVVALKDKMHHDQLLAWVQDLKIPASRRRLYLTMLGICGTPDDAKLLEPMLRSEDREVKAGLDAMIACYLILEGPAGLPLVEDLFLKNDKAEYADTYAAIMALRFHGTETNVIDKQRLVQSLRHMLGRAELADLVIPDLAKWEDWESLPQMVELFRQADENSSWVRVPVINYLRVCPLPEAKRQIKELSEIDPEAVRRAETFFPFDATGDGQGAAKKATPEDPSAQQQPEDAAAETTDAPALVQPSPVDETAMIPATESRVPPEVSPDAAASAVVPAASAAVPVGPPAAAPAADRPTLLTRPPHLAQANEVAASGQVDMPVWTPNLFQLWGVPVLVGLGLMWVLRLVLGLPLLRLRP